MRVMATKLGYYDLKRRKEGAEFSIDPKLFSAKWMKKLEAGETSQEEDYPKKAQASKPSSRKVPSSNDDVI